MNAKEWIRRISFKNEKQNHLQTKITENIWYQHKKCKGHGTECTSGSRKV